ncbi:glycosyltransferase [Paenibacillus sp.]|uniref:glycosyltransferase n=1 Tax=Paenibacillus sp. TaxID=58172 RepID=UPI002D4DCA7F|nr:glycosyltransferase [Paenibacillus sp.]HZG86177.1 glycosyltransferase [Paenibacillus sp.]
MSERNEPEISIVICTYNRADVLERTLTYLLGVNGINLTEVIIVDNNSTDHTRQIVEKFVPRFQRMIYVLEIKQGLSIARNTGVKRAQAPIIAFLDDDAFPEKHWCKSILEGFQVNDKIMALGGIIELEFDGERPSWLLPQLEPLYSCLDLGDTQGPFPNLLHPLGANMAFRCEVFHQHKFPENLGRKGKSLLSGEESYLFSLIRRDKGIIYYFPKMKVRHFVAKDRLSKDWLIRRYKAEGVSKAMGAMTIFRRFALFAVTITKILLLIAEKPFLKLKGDGHTLLNNCRLTSQFAAMNELFRGKTGT